MPKKAKPAVQCQTIWGRLIAAAGAALPLVQAELAAGQPDSTTRWMSFGLGVLGAALVAQGRAGRSAPVRGHFRANGD